MSGYIYLVHEREFINSNKHIYKLGRTQNAGKRMSGYPKNSRLMLCIFTVNHVEVETHLLTVFNEKFKRCDDIGKEYFNGYFSEMMQIIVSYVNEVNNYTDIANLSHKEEETVVTTKEKDSMSCISEYVNVYRDEFSKSVFKCCEFFANFNEWLKQQGYNELNSMQKMIKDLKQIYKVESRSYDFESGVDLGLLFPDLKPMDKLWGNFYYFVDDFVEKSPDSTFTVKEALELYRKVCLNSQCLIPTDVVKKKLEIALNTACVAQTIIEGKKLRNVFLGYKLKEYDV